MTLSWTLRAVKSYFAVADYLQKKWGHQVVINFTNEVDRVIHEISENPQIFEASKKSVYIRKGLITEHNTMFYRIKPRKNEIEILLFWDNRRDDKKRPY